jgi:hypothetical protein
MALLIAMPLMVPATPADAKSTATADAQRQERLDRWCKMNTRGNNKAFARREARGCFDGTIASRPKARPTEFSSQRRAPLTAPERQARFDRWCKMNLGELRGDKMFLRREAMGCFR